MDIRSMPPVDKDQKIALEKIMALVQSPAFPGKLMPEHVTQFQSKISSFSESELLVVTQKIEEEIFVLDYAARSLSGLLHRKAEV